MKIGRIRFKPLSLLMGMYRYSFPENKFDKERMVRASGRNLNISRKHAVEIMREIRGMRLNDAMRLLEDVIALKRPIPFKRFKRNVGHRRELQGRKSGRYPQKAAKHILKVLQNLKANAEDKGLDPNRIRIIHAVAHKGPRRYKRVPRAFGMSAPERVQYVHVEVIGEEVR